MKGLIVFCNTPDQACAEHLAALLVEERLAACVNIMAPCRSVYRWEGKTESVSEVPLMIKTCDEVYARLEARLCALHPYQVPEILACKIADGLTSYLTWVEAAVFSSDASD